MNEVSRHSLLSWIERLPMIAVCFSKYLTSKPCGSADSFDALQTAFEMTDADSVYFVCDAPCVKNPQLVCKSAQSSKKTVHASTINMDDEETLVFLEKVTGRIAPHAHDR